LFVEGQRNWGKPLSQKKKAGKENKQIKFPKKKKNINKNLLKSSNFHTIGSSMSPKYSRILKFFLLSSLTSSQIWLIPLMDDHQR